MSSKEFIDKLTIVRSKELKVVKKVFDLAKECMQIAVNEVMQLVKNSDYD